MERVRQEAVAHAAPSPQQRRRLRLSEGEDPGLDRLTVGGATLLQPAQPPAQAVDVEVQDGGDEPSPAARPRGAEPAEDRPLLEAGRLQRRQAILQQSDEDVEIAPRGRRARQTPEDPQGPGEPPAPVPACEQTQCDAQPARRDPELVDGLLAADEGARQLLKHATRVLAQKRGGSPGKRVGGHGNITAARKPSMPRRQG